jgi:hypothetical protein
LDGRERAVVGTAKDAEDGRRLQPRCAGAAVVDDVHCQMSAISTGNAVISLGVPASGQHDPRLHLTGRRRRGTLLIWLVHPTSVADVEQQVGWSVVYDVGSG